MRRLAACLLALALVPNAATAQAATPAVNPDVGVPVFPHDITDRRYEIVGDIHANIRKATIFSREASQKKIYRELWERARKLGADAVVNARYGDARVTALSWGATEATGTAVRFVDPR